MPEVLVMVRVGVAETIDIEADEVSTIPSAEMVAMLSRVTLGVAIVEETSITTLANENDPSLDAV